jgi:hypothetical protein
MNNMNLKKPKKDFNDEINIYTDKMTNILAVDNESKFATIDAIQNVLLIVTTIVSKKTDSFILTIDIILHRI